MKKSIESVEGVSLLLLFKYLLHIETIIIISFFLSVLHYKIAIKKKRTLDQLVQIMQYKISQMSGK